MNWIEEHPVLTLLVVVLFAIACVGVQAYEEARTFNKLTHRMDVTTWDALWVSLRVDCTPIP